MTRKQLARTLGISESSLYRHRRNGMPDDITGARKYLSEVSGRVEAPKAQQGRSFTAALSSRLNSDWSATDTSIDALLYGSLRVIRNRSRERERNDDFIRRYVHILQQNVPGPTGIRLKSMARDPSGALDAADCRMLETHYQRWCRPGVLTVCGGYSMAALERMRIARLAVDGEFLVKLVPGFKGNEYRFALQILDPDLLDETKNQKAGNGKPRITMGVEYDAYGRPTAYWLRDDAGGVDGVTTYGRSTPVPASQIIHDFVRERPNQSRGFPWTVAGLQRKKWLDGFEDAMVVGARVAASKMGFFKKQLTIDSELGNDTVSNGDFITDVEPGTFEKLPEGWDFEAFDPGYPTAAPGEFLKEIKKGLSSGLNLSYHTLAADLSEVNYSSARVGELQDRKYFRQLQNDQVEYFSCPVFEQWLSAAFLAGAIRDLSTGAAVPASRMVKFLNYRWRLPGWEWVDPAKHESANRIALENGTTSPRAIVEAQSGDYDELIEELVADKAMREAKGLALLALPAGAGLPVDGGDPADLDADPDSAARQSLRDSMETYGIGVRAGAVTPQVIDEDHFRKQLNLPVKSKDVDAAWKEDGGIRRPNTLKAKGEAAAPGFAAPPKPDEE